MMLLWDSDHPVPSHTLGLQLYLRFGSVRLGPGCQQGPVIPNLRSDWGAVLTNRGWLPIHRALGASQAAVDLGARSIDTKDLHLFTASFMVSLPFMVYSDLQNSAAFGRNRWRLTSSIDLQTATDPTTEVDFDGPERGLLEASTSADLGGFGWWFGPGARTKP